MNKLFASLLIVVFAAMSAVAHGKPLQAMQNIEQSDISPACNGVTKKPIYCDSLHCVFHFVFLDETTVPSVDHAGHNHLTALDTKLIALLSYSRKKPPRLDM